MCPSFFQIQDLGQSRSKSAFSQNDTYLAFSFLFPSVLLSCQHHLKAKFLMYLSQPSFDIFEWCVQQSRWKLLLDIVAHLIFTLRRDFKGTLKNVPYFFRLAKAPKIFLRHGTHFFFFFIYLVKPSFFLVCHLRKSQVLLPPKKKCGRSYRVPFKSFPRLQIKWASIVLADLIGVYQAQQCLSESFECMLAMIYDFFHSSDNS